MKKTVLFLLILAASVITSCSSKLICSKFYTYRTNKVDIKGITTKLKKQGVEVADIGVAEISIDPKYVVATNKLQELDLLQFSMCGQIKGLRKKSPARESATLDYIKTLKQMLQIAQTPSSDTTATK